MLYSVRHASDNHLGGGTGNTDWEYIQVFRVEQEPSSGKVRLNLLNDMSCRLSGGTHITSDGDLALLASERRTKVLDGGLLRGPVDILVRYREDLDLGY